MNTDTSDIREWLYAQSDDAVVAEIAALRALLRRCRERIEALAEHENLFIRAGLGENLSTEDFMKSYKRLDFGSGQAQALLSELKALEEK